MTAGRTDDRSGPGTSSSSILFIQFNRQPIGIPKNSIPEQVEQLKAVLDPVQAFLADHERPADHFLLMVIGDDAHRVLLGDLREVPDQGCPFYDLLGRAVAGEDGMLLEHEQGLERGAMERVQLHPQLFEIFHG